MKTKNQSALAQTSEPIVGKLDAQTQGVTVTFARPKKRATLQGYRARILRKEVEQLICSCLFKGEAS